MKIRALALAAALLLTLAGCSGLDLGKYPRVEASGGPSVEPDTLVLLLPPDADDPLMNMTYLLGAKLSELSGGALTLETLTAEEGASLQPDEWDLAFYTNEDLVAADEEMEFLMAPFLFPTRESFLTILGGESGPVRSDPDLPGVLGGKIIALYYGGAMGFYCRGRFYDEIGFSGANIGLLESSASGAAFYETLSELAAKSVTTSDEKGLLTLVGSEKIKYMEARRGRALPDYALDSFKYYEDTNHRYLGYWLVLSQNTDPQLTPMIQEAVAYTLESQEQDRLAAETLVLDALPASYRDNKDGYPTLCQAARSLYRKSDTRVCVTQEIWDRLSPLLP